MKWGSLILAACLLACAPLSQNSRLTGLEALDFVELENGELQAVEGHLTVKQGLVGEMGLEDAQLYMDKKADLIQGMYASIPSPYPGMISDEIECSSEFQPMVKLSDGELFIEGFLTSRGTFGACAWDLISYKTHLKYLYCDGELVYVQAIFPIDEDESIVEQVSCLE